MSAIRVRDQQIGDVWFVYDGDCHLCTAAAQALRIRKMGLLWGRQGRFNQLNEHLFRSRLLAAICYPPMRAARNLLLQLIGVTKIGNTDEQ